MTEHGRRRLVDLSVIALSALVIGGGALVVADVDSHRPQVPTVPLANTLKGTASPPAPPTNAPPVPGLQPAPQAGKRTIFLRRTRPS